MESTLTPLPGCPKDGVHFWCLLANDVLPDQITVCYTTWHRFPALYAEHVATHGTVAGYEGPTFADAIPFDFDGDDLAVVHQRVQTFLPMLEVAFEITAGVRCFFSGAKGFHVLLPTALFGAIEPSPDLHRRLKDLALHLAEGVDIDPAIYDKNRLLRIPNSINGRSGLYKIPLVANEVMTLSTPAILEMARSERTVEWPEWDDCVPSPVCAELWQSGTSATYSIPRVQSLFSVGLKEGDGRDNEAFAIARYCRDHGFPETTTVDLLNVWDRAQCDSLGMKVLEEKARSAYSRIQETDGLSAADILTPSDLAAAYATYIESLKERKITLGLGPIDDRLRGIVPGEVCTIIAKSGAGKSAVLQNVLRNIARHQETVSLFLSLEQPTPQVFERYAQLATGEAGEEIEASWAEREEAITAAVTDELGPNALTCGRSALKFEQLSQALEAAEDRIGRRVDVLAVDYLGLIDTSDLERTLYGQVSRAAREMKNLAKQREIAIITLCQVSRAGGDDGSQRLTINSARESGAIEESADFLLGLYRPDLHAEDRSIAVQILKNRKGQQGIEFCFAFDRKSLRINPAELMLAGTLEVPTRREY